MLAASSHVLHDKTELTWSCVGCVLNVWFLLALFRIVSKHIAKIVAEQAGRKFCFTFVVDYEKDEGDR